MTTWQQMDIFGVTMLFAVMKGANKGESRWDLELFDAATIQLYYHTYQTLTPSEFAISSLGMAMGMPRLDRTATQV
jgi:hypothetical protein